MAKATVTTADGITVKVDGSPDEIAAIVRKLRAEAVPRNAERPPGLRHRRSRKKPRAKGDLAGQIGSLIDGGFFRKGKDLAEVKEALAVIGHHYPLTTLSGAMLRLVRRGDLSREKQDKRWVYSGGAK